MMETSYKTMVFFTFDAFKELSFFDRRRPSFDNVMKYLTLDGTRPYNFNDKIVIGRREYYTIQRSNKGYLFERLKDYKWDIALKILDFSEIGFKLAGEERYTRIESTSPYDF